MLCFTRLVWQLTGGLNPCRQLGTAQTCHLTTEVALVSLDNTHAATKLSVDSQGGMVSSPSMGGQCTRLSDDESPHALFLP